MTVLRSAVCALAKLVDRGISAKGGHYSDAAVVEYAFYFKSVTADVVLTEQVDLEFAVFDVVIETHDVGENTVVGNVVAGRLAYALVALATEPEHVDPQLFLHLPGHGVYVVADEPYRASGENADALGLNRS